MMPDLAQAHDAAVARAALNKFAGEMVRHFDAGGDCTRDAIANIFERVSAQYPLIFAGEKAA